MKCTTPLISYKYFLGILPLLIILPLKGIDCTEEGIHKNLSFCKVKKNCWHHQYLQKRPQTHKKEIPVKLITSDNLIRNAVIALSPNAKGTVVLCHPAAYDKDFMIPYNDILFPDFHTIRFDFRRHGDDAHKQYTTMGRKEAREIRAAVHVLKNYPQIAGTPLFGFGISMGAAALVQAQSKTPLFDGLILQSMFDTIGSQFKRFSRFYSFFPFLIFRHPTTLFAKYCHRWDLKKVKPIDLIGNITVPICLIHAQNDRFIAPQTYDRLCAKHPQYITHCWAPEKGKHTDVLKENQESYRALCIDFLEKCLARTPAAMSDSFLTAAMQGLKPPLIAKIDNTESD